MKLSLKRKFGWTHVRAGQFYRVTKTHAVSPFTESQIEPTSRLKGPGDNCFAKEGDLAVAYIAASGPKQGQVVTIGYLSGDAIRLHQPEFDWGWFKPASSVRVHVAPPDVDPDAAPGAAEKFLGDLIQRMMTVKYFFDVGVVQCRIPRTADPDPVMNVVSRTYFYEHAPKEGEEPLVAKGHLFGAIYKGKSKGCSTFHCEPPSVVTKDGASIFQIKLVAAAPCKEEIGGEAT